MIRSTLLTQGNLLHDFSCLKVDETSWRYKITLVHYPSWIKRCHSHPTDFPVPVLCITLDVWSWCAGWEILLIRMISDRFRSNICSVFQSNWLSFWIFSYGRLHSLHLAWSHLLSFLVYWNDLRAHYVRWKAIVVDWEGRCWPGTVGSIRDNTGSWCPCRVSAYNRR